MIIDILAAYPLKDNIPCKYKSGTWNGCIIVYRLKFFSEFQQWFADFETAFNGPPVAIPADDSMLKATGIKLKPSVHPIVRRLKPLTFFPITWSNMKANNSTDLLRLRPITESSITRAQNRFSEVSLSKIQMTFAIIDEQFSNYDHLGQCRLGLVFFVHLSGLESSGIVYCIMKM